MLRTYLRYFPGATGKEALWNRVVNPYLAWQSRKFVARTIFGQSLAGDTKDMIQQYIYFSNWVSNTQASVQQSGPETFGADVYAFDVTKPNSLKLVIEGRWSQFFDDPPREEDGASSAL